MRRPDSPWSCPARPRARLRERLPHHAAGRALARRGVELRPLGRLARRRPGRRTRLLHGTRSMQQVQPPTSHRKLACDDAHRLLRLAPLSRPLVESGRRDDKSAGRSFRAAVAWELCIGSRGVRRAARGDGILAVPRQEPSGAALPPQLGESAAARSLAFRDPDLLDPRERAVYLFPILTAMAHSAAKPYGVRGLVRAFGRRLIAVECGQASNSRGPLDAALLWRQVAKAAKAVTRHRTPNSCRLGAKLHGYRQRTQR